MMWSSTTTRRGDTRRRNTTNGPSSDEKTPASSSSSSSGLTSVFAVTPRMVVAGGGVALLLFFYQSMMMSFNSKGENDDGSTFSTSRTPSNATTNNNNNNNNNNKYGGCAFGAPPPPPREKTTSSSTEEEFRRRLERWLKLRERRRARPCCEEEDDSEDDNNNKKKTEKKKKVEEQVVSWSSSSKSADSCKRCATPNLPSGSLGTCAVVGLGETALDGEFGREIDAHDTVIRFGYAPTKGYEKYVGTRTDVALVRMHRFERGCDLDKDVWGFEPKPPKKFYLLLQTDSKGKGNGMKVPSSLSRSTRQHKCNPSDVGVYRGVRVLYIKDPPPEVTDVRDKLFADGVRKSSESSDKTTFLRVDDEKKPTSGFYLVWSLLGSELCSSIDLYGFSSNNDHSSHYFALEVLEDGSRVANKNLKNMEGFPTAGNAMKPVHALDAESAAFRSAMASGALCVRWEANVDVSLLSSSSSSLLLSSSSSSSSLSSSSSSSCAKIKPEWVQHTAQKISRASVVSEPYEHVQIFDVFHPDMYACMLRKLPVSDEPYERLKPGVNRFMISLYDYKKKAKRKKKKNNKTIQDGFDADFWKEFGRVFSGKLFRDRWLALFDRTLTLRNPSWRNYAARELAFKVELNRDRDRYEIGPHTDSHGKWVTMLYYLPKDDTHESDGGTAVIRSKSRREQFGDSTWESWTDPDFEVVRRARYVPNSVFAFAPCLSSWHAVPKLQQAFVRDSIQTFIMSKQWKDKKSHCPVARDVT